MARAREQKEGERPVYDYLPARSEDGILGGYIQVRYARVESEGEGAKSNRKRRCF